jgi:hypothetical protein
MAHRRGCEGDVQRCGLARGCAIIAGDRAVAGGKVNHFELEVGLRLHAREKGATVLNQRRIARIALVETAREVMAAHDIDRSEMMASGDLVGQHTAQSPVIELPIRLALGTAQLERARAQPIGVDE